MKSRILLVVSSCAASVVTGLVLAHRSPAVSSSSKSGRVLIGFSMDTLKEERWRYDRDFFVSRAKGLGADVLVETANSSDVRQMQDVQALISLGVRVLVIVPHNGEAMAKAVAMAHKADIPVISYDRLITHSDPDLYMTFDPVRVGRLQAQYLIDRFKGRWPLRIVRINGDKGDSNSSLVRQGQDNVLGPYMKEGKAEIIHDDWALNWKPEEAKKITEAAITRYGHNFEAVLAANDGTAGGAIQALSEEGLAGKIVVTGQDAELAACQRIIRGVQAMTIYKPLRLLAGAAAETAVRMAEGKPVIAGAAIDNGQIKIPSILLDDIVVTKDNMMETVVKDGYHAKDQIYQE